MFKQFLQMLFWKRDMQKHADWFDNHEPAQARFEENEEEAFMDKRRGRGMCRL